MIFSRLRFLITSIVGNFYRSGWRAIATVLLVLISWSLLMGTPSALAGINDDRYDGNIFTLYGGNAGLVPPKTTLQRSLKNDRATLLVFYVDDSSDCKQFAPVVSRLQGFYVRVTDFIPIPVDSIPVKSNYQPDEPGYYYEGVIPQAVVFDRSGKVVLNVKGQVAFEKLDDAFREVFELLPRSESVELKRRPINEFNTELSE